MDIICDVIVAVLAVFGGYCALKLLSERIFSFRGFMPSAAVRLDGSEDDEYIDALLSEARASWQHRKRLMVLIPPGDPGLAKRVHRLCPSAEIIEDITLT